MILDAGGGTIDISSYSIASISPISVEEVAAADCKPYYTSALIFDDSADAVHRHCAWFDSGGRSGEKVPARYGLNTRRHHTDTH